jgi:ketosteroid isomerase-like protein
MKDGNYSKGKALMKSGVRYLAMISLFVVVLIPQLANAQVTISQPDEQKAKEAMLKTDERFNQAVLAKDGLTLDQILADKLSWVARGDRLNKKQVIADIQTQNLHFKSLSHDDLDVKMFGDLAVVTGHSTSVLEYKGQLFTTPRLFTTVYLKLDGRWQMIAHQVSNVGEK